MPTPQKIFSPKTRIIFHLRLSYPHQTETVLYPIDSDIGLAELQEYLYLNDWLLSKKEEVLAVEEPGEGNMNVVLRVTTDRRSFILKQSRPFVRKYRQIEAPLKRIAVEKKFYKAIIGGALNAHIPKVLGYDKKDHLLLLEDLGSCEDMTSIYQKREIDKDKFRKLVFILGLIHRTKVSPDFPENRAMRKLNHEHIFELPFLGDNGFSLDDIQPGLQQVALPYKKDDGLKRTIREIGKRYLSEGDTLVHGDYYPGSWMTETNNLYVIDPEFGFVGFAEFDLGVMAAHLVMATGRKKFLGRIENLYEGTIDSKLMAQVAGIEIMRRLIGLAQLPMERTIDEKKTLLKKAYKMIMK